MLNIYLAELIKRSITGIILVISVGGAYLHSMYLFVASLIVLLGITLIYEWPKLVDLHRPSRMLFTIIYPILPFTALMVLTYRYHETDFYLPLLPFIMSWAADTGGYFVGKLAGNHKMCPSISPGKSWEGFIGSVLSVFVACWYFLPKINLLATTIIATNYYAMACFAFIVTTISFLGGFFLSLLKRKEGLKDAGSLLPGHGGILDRFDGVLFVALTTLAITLIYRF